MISPCREFRSALEQLPEQGAHGPDEPQCPRDLHHDEIDGIGEGKEKDEHKARHIDARALGALHEQHEARARESEAHAGEGPELLLEKQGHEPGGQDRIPEEQGGGEARVHEAVGLVERQRKGP